MEPGCVTVDQGFRYSVYLAARVTTALLDTAETAGGVALFMLTAGEGHTASEAQDSIKIRNTDKAPEAAAGGRGGFKKPRSGSAKDRASDPPSWAKGTPPKMGESGKDYATRLMDQKYGPGSYKKGADSEFSKIQKYGDRAWE